MGNRFIKEDEFIRSLVRRLIKLEEEVQERQKYLQSQFLDNQEVCQLFNISKRTLAEWRNTGTLAYVKIGNKLFYRIEDIQQMIESHLVKPEVTSQGDVTSKLETKTNLNVQQ